MEKRILTITLQADWKATLRAAGKAAQKDSYQGEILNFQSPSAFFSRRLTKNYSLFIARDHASSSCS